MTYQGDQRGKGRDKPLHRTYREPKSFWYYSGSIYWDELKSSISFRKEQKKLYFKYPSVIPSNLWYSVNPYIDEVVRQERFKP